jgi:hypothetical protein
MVDLEPVCMVLGLGDIFTKVSTVFPMAVYITLASTLETITDDNALKTYKLLELMVLECMAISRIVFGLNCIHVSPVHYAGV